MSSLAEAIFEHSGSLKVSVAFPPCAAKVHTSDGYGYDVVTPFSVTSTVRKVGSTGAGSSSTRHGFPWRIAELTAASAAESCSFEVARKNCSAQRFGLVDWKQARSLGSVSYTHLRAHETPEHLVCRLL